MLIFKEGLGSSPSFWTAALQTKCQKLTEPRILRETTDSKSKKKEGGKVRIDCSAYRVVKIHYRKKIYDNIVKDSVTVTSSNFSLNDGMIRILAHFIQLV